MNPRISFSLVFLATATLFLAGEVKSDVCAGTDYPTLCRNTVKKITDPVKATEATIKYAILRTKHAMLITRTMQKNENTDTCAEMYEDAISDLSNSINDLRNRDRGSVNTKLSAAISYYSSCDDVCSEASEMNRLLNVNNVLENLVDNSLVLVSKLK